MKINIMMKKVVFMVVGIVMLSLSSVSVWASTSEEIDSKSKVTLELFKETVAGGKLLLKDAKGVLVFPEVVKVGLGFGGEYGEGALKINGYTVDYYNNISLSVGFQLGVQSKSVVILFLDSDALRNFRDSKGWKAGVDGSIAVAEWGIDKDASTLTEAKPIVAYIFNNKGLMYNLTIEGSKFTKIVR